MKVDTSKLKKGSSELTPECRQLIEQITKCRSPTELLQFLDTVHVWIYGKCELFHWIAILDRFDKILEEAAQQINDNEFVLRCDTLFAPEDIRLLLQVLNFTTLLIEHSFSRHLYNSIEHLTQLLSSQNMDIVLAVLNLLYMFSKRSNFIPRLSFDKKELLLIKLFNMAERWGDPNYGLALIDCCMRKPKLDFLYQLFIEYADENGHTSLLEIPDMLELCSNCEPAIIVNMICEQLSCPSHFVKIRIAHRVRLVSGFKNYNLRLQFVQARLQAVSILIYSNALQDNIDKILYPGFGEELCELIDKEDAHLVDIRAAVLRTLTSMLHFDRNPNVPRSGTRLPKIIQYTGAERQGGILPLLVRECITCLTQSGPSGNYPLVLATSLFSLLYHLASYEAGGRALVKSGMMESLMQVINWPGVDIEHITFVTRAVRVIDLITNIDIAKFHQNNGLNIFIDRLEKEVNGCRDVIAEALEKKSQSETDIRGNQATNTRNELTEMTTSSRGMGEDAVLLSTETENRNETDSSEVEDLTLETIDQALENEREVNFRCYNENIEAEPVPGRQSNTEGATRSNCFERFQDERNAEGDYSFQAVKPTSLACVTQRAALLKSMLNFLKKSIQDHAHFNGMRNIMETSLPNSLRHIISNAEYYGPSLFLLATDVVTVYVFNEPSLLSSLQDSGITNVMLRSLLQKEVPATREVLGSLPNVFSALCLNERGLMEFMSYQPFDKLLKVLLSPDYLVAMRRRRSSDPLGDTATNLGIAMDDLMKHHPYLRTDATEAIVRLLNELVYLGTNSNYICWRANKDTNSSNSNNVGNINSGPTTQHHLNNVQLVNETGNNENENDSSEDDDDDDEMSSASQQQQHQQRQNRPCDNQQLFIHSNAHEREAIPLIDYILNVMKFVEAIFSNSSNGEHCREFVLHGGLKPLLQLLSLPNLPVDSPVSTTAQAVANVCKSIWNLTHETKVIDTALQQLSQIVDQLKPFTKHFNFPCGSILLRELLSCPKLDDGFSVADYTPLLHSMSSVHSYVVMLVYLCRNASNEMRVILLKRWGSNNETGLQLLKNLVQLYISLVWESTILLSLCSDEPYIQNSGLNWDELWSNSAATKSESNTPEGETASDATRKSERATTSKQKCKTEEQLRFIKSLLAASSRLGRALAELFGTLVKLSVGMPQSRQRRNNDYLSNAGSSKLPTPEAKQIARVLSSILVNGFNHENILPKPAPKLKLTFLICSVGFTGPMLFDDKRSSFHLMISQFCEENGLKAFFEMFYWALSLDGSSYNFCFENYLKMENILELNDSDECDFPEGTGEFLDAWLQLLEKMVNPRAILESPYAVAPRLNHLQDAIQFEPIFYLIQVHQLALQTIRYIWKRKPIPNYGVSMTETMMVILKHLVGSHEMLKEKFEARNNEINASKMLDCSNSSRKDEANVNVDHLKMLIDMGFLRPYVMEALRNTNSLEQATDYLLNHSDGNTSSTSHSRDDSGANAMQNPNNEMDVDINSPPEPEKSSVSPTKINLISDKTFNKFCEDTLERTFAFMEFLPETVNTGVELISVLYGRHNHTDKHLFVLNLIKNISECADHILCGIQNIDSKSEHLNELMCGEIATKLFIRLKVSTLFLDEMYSDIRKGFCNAIAHDQTLNMLILLLTNAEGILQEQATMDIKPSNPRWLQNLVEFIDAVDNVSIILQRKDNMKSVCSDNWKWYDASTGKWNSYSEGNNLILKNAFNLGERSVVINIGRQRYTINFNCMTQVSEPSGSHRPVLPALKITDAIASFTCGNPNSKVDNILTRTIKSKNDSGKTMQQDEIICFHSLLSNGSNKNNTDGLINSDEKKKNNTTNDHSSSELHSFLVPPFSQPSSELNELSSSSSNSKKSKNKGTPKGNSKKSSIVPLKRVLKVVLHEEALGLSKFNTVSLLTSLVHLLHAKLCLNFETKLSILKLCARLTKDYENAKVFFQCGGMRILLNMRQTCGLMGFPVYAIVIIRHMLEAPAVLQEAIGRILTIRTSQQLPIGHRDLIFVLTQVSSAVARNPSIFLAAAKQILRCDSMSTSAISFDDSRVLVKSQSSANRKSTTAKPEIDIAAAYISVQVIKELLLAIVQPCIHYEVVPVDNVSQNESPQDLDLTTVQHNTAAKGSTIKKPMEKFEPCCCSWHIPSSGHLHQKPILPRSTLLKILADAVRSYQSLVPRIIIEHIYVPTDSVLIKKKQSCLSFILDHFLPIVKRTQDSEVSMMSRVLITSLSDCYGQSTIQTKVAEEIHNAIARTLSFPDSGEKHIRLQVLIGLLPAMIENPMMSSKIHVQRNNMYRILLRQGIMTDLAKMAQYKDLSNSNTLATISAILRPMEILLRLTVAPGNFSSKRIFFGTSPYGTNSIVNRRFYPRLISRTTSSNSIGSEHVLRDIIRNVLSDRRHAFDFIFNTDDMLVDSEDGAPTTATSAEDETEDNDSSIAASSSRRPQFNFDRLWDDLLLQNEGLGFVNRNTSTTNTATRNNGLPTADRHRLLTNNDEASNNDNGVSGGSDGASTSSETVAAVADNLTSLLGEVSPSESDSDSNVSTENDDRNDEEEDDDDETDGNEEGIEDRSETDADEETRQFIEVFDHIYEPESSETASNDADADADDEASEVGINRNAIASNIEGSDGREPNVVEGHISNNEGVHEPTVTCVISEQASSTDAAPSSSEPIHNSIPESYTPESSVSSSLRTMPTSAWITPRMNFIDTSNQITYRTSINLNLSRSDVATAANNDQNENSATSGISTVHINTTGNTNQSITTSGRREPSRRLVFLDQQYYAPMPSFNNPTEEGQIELFNQDALHWWLEEAKHLDLESQTDVCLHVAHLLIPFLLKELKVANNEKKVEVASASSASTLNSGNRRSAIPVLIQQTPNATILLSNENTSETTDTTGPTTLEITPAPETRQFRIPLSTRAPRFSVLSHQMDQQNVEVNILGEVDGSSEDEHNQVSDVIDIEDDDEPEYEGEDDEFNTALMEEDELNSTFNAAFVNEITNVLSQSNATSSIETSEGASESAVFNENIQNLSINEPRNTTAFDPPVNNDAVEQQESRSVTASSSTTFTTVPESNSGVTESSHSENVPVSRSTNAPEISPEVRAALGDLEVPEGVDPSFLAALPSEMREEVIQEHLRMQRIRQRAQQNAIQVAHDSLLEVNPEFLAALPPNIQSEVLMQQRIEQQRQAAQSSNPDDPVDTAAFFQNLPESLRQAILTDMDESQIASLPPELAAEAQFLRRDWESRNNARLDAAQSNSLSGYLTARFPSSLQGLNDESRWHTNSIWYDANNTPQSQHHQHTTIIHPQQLQGKPIALLLMEDENNLLDPDSLSTLLLFLFIEDPKINHTRFHRVLRNLCYHLPTRDWIINAIISIIHKTNETKLNYPVQKAVKPHWLKLRIDAAFGYKSNIFIMNKSVKSDKFGAATEYTIHINPQAAQMIVRNCLDMLFVLAKHFPHSFVPFNRENKIPSKTMESNIPDDDTSGSNASATGTSSTNTSPRIESDREEHRDNFHRQRGSSSNSRKTSVSSKHSDTKVNDSKLDDTPSTSKAAALRNQSKCISSSNKSKSPKEIQYNTNTNNFWDVLLNIDINTQHRLANLDEFPIKSQPNWEWENVSPEFLSFNESAFAKLLEMLPYKVICRSPQLTDILVKLLAYLSSELPKEEEQQPVLPKQPDSPNRSRAIVLTGETVNNRNKELISGDSSSDEEDKNSLQPTMSKNKRKMYTKNFSQLQLVIEVLTHQCGTTDCLDNISKLIVHLSQCSQASNAIFLQYLTAAIHGLALEVQQAIKNLLHEIKTYNCSSETGSSTLVPYMPMSNPSIHGIMQDRFTSENVVISAPANIKPSCELQLPAMKKLLSASSAQPYFLRTLKIFMQIRDLFDADDNAVDNSKPTLSQTICLDDLWNTLSECLAALEQSKDEYAVLVLQPTVEAFFLIHATLKKNANKPSGSTSPSTQQNETSETVEANNINPTPMEGGTSDTNEQSNSVPGKSEASKTPSDVSDIGNNTREVQLKLDLLKFLFFAEKHRKVLNQILRQSSTHLSDGPFAVLVDHTRILDFDVKRKYFQTELERIDEGVRREENTVSVRRVTVFEDSFRVLYRLSPEEWKNRFYIVFEEEEGQDAGGLLREWYVIISREIFNPMYALFCVSPGDRVTYMINPSSHANPNHLSYFKFVGRVIAKAIHDNKLLECYFTRSFYKHILGKLVKYTDMESQDYEFYKGLDYLMKNDISTLGYELTFSTEVQEFGVTQVRDLIPNGRDIAVTEENKFDYVQLVCQLKMSGSIRQQLDAFLEGFYDIIPKHLIAIFNEQELELLISGLPDIDIEDLKGNTEYHKYTSKSIQIQWFWRSLRSFDQADRAKFLQFVTGTSKVPLQGFGSLEGMNGIQKFQIHRDDRSTDRLPCAHTCFNQLDLPMYKSYDKLRSCLLKAIHECSEGFGFA